MDKNLNLPRKYDLVLGGQNLAPVGAAVLGGIEGQIKRLAGINTKIEVAKFQTVTVSDRGDNIQRETKKARYFVEDLGNGITLEMVYIPDGSFLMSSSETEEYNTQKPPQEVKIEPFFIGKFQVTQAQWKAVASLPIVNRNLRSNPAYFDNDNHPVERVSWYDAIEFCQRLSKKTGREYKLPFEAQWEYACRAGTITSFHCGETITTDLANYNGNFTYGSEPKGEYLCRTTSVGSFYPNGFGLYDMHGNVWEWCIEAWHKNYIGTISDRGDRPNSNEELLPILRGGSWHSYRNYCGSAHRYIIRARNFIYNSIGFRVVCNVSSII